MFSANDVLSVGAPQKLTDVGSHDDFYLKYKHNATVYKKSNHLIPHKPLQNTTKYSESNIIPFELTKVL